MRSYEFRLELSLGHLLQPPQNTQCVVTDPYYRNLSHLGTRAILRLFQFLQSYKNGSEKIQAKCHVLWMRLVYEAGLMAKKVPALNSLTM